YSTGFPAAIRHSANHRAFLMAEPYPGPDRLSRGNLINGPSLYLSRGNSNKRSVPLSTAAAKPTSSCPDARPIHFAAERLTQRTVKFIRWLKNHLDLERDWDRAIARLN
ncbi:MAG: hypothetical protein MUF13_11090, partial [Akkermansiaceae bacterium]|nr:hypothetical protein [Akkermansiaceae bacterium]